MRRKLFTFFSVVSLLLCVAVCVLWVRVGVTRSSRVTLAEFDWHRHRRAFEVGRYGFAVSARPEWREALKRAEAERDEEFMRFQEYVIAHPTTRPEDEHALEVMTHAVSHGRATFKSIRYGRLVADGIAHPVRFPTVLTVTGVLPLAWATATVTSFLIRHRRRALRRCPQCGYDLRATPDRCPECGRAAA